MEVSLKQQLEEQIKICLGGLAYTEQGEEQHQRLVGDIQKLVQALAELEKTEHAIIDSDRRFAEEVREKDLELHYRDTLERDKLQEQKKAGIRDAVIRASGTILQLGLYGVFLGIGMKLEFLDNGSICSFSVKELIKKASTVVKV